MTPEGSATGVNLGWTRGYGGRKYPTRRLALGVVYLVTVLSWCRSFTRAVRHYADLCKGGSLSG